MSIVDPYPAIQLSGYRATVQYILWFFLITRLVQNDHDFMRVYITLCAVAVSYTHLLWICGDLNERRILHHLLRLRRGDDGSAGGEVFVEFEGADIPAEGVVGKQIQARVKVRQILRQQLVGLKPQKMHVLQRAQHVELCPRLFAANERKAPVWMRLCRRFHITILHTPVSYTHLDVYKRQMQP